MKPRIRVLDAGYGNVFSVRQALLKAGARIVEEGEDGVVLPGVGAFDTAAGKLAQAKEALEDKKPFLGICLGMQLLFQRSKEGQANGLGVLKGTVRKMKNKTLPHMGWNTVEFEDSRLAEGIEKPWFYFVHSFACPQSRFVNGWTEYGQRFASVVEKENVFGVQFHPEKSGQSGATLLENFVEVVRQWK
ncbi:imidazole glycerol phosphate synthase subunit HisH [Candidatus Micrarchaeota archaeon]|nr:imidazole glycerol phosphate synthase subunit HisH [Candidatus Micrarchaeota archaeon]